MNAHLSKPKLIAVAAFAFFGGVLFASSMDWTKLLAAQGRPGAPVVNVSTAGAVDQQNGFVAVADKVTPAVVSIQAERDPRKTASNNQQDPRRRARIQGVPPGFEQFFGAPEDQEDQGAAASGTGFIVSKDGYVLTNNHVVEGMDRVVVKLTDRREFKATLVGRDPQTDVAVLKIDGSGLPALTFGDDNTTRVGEWVVAVGNPLGLDFTVTAGIVSAKGRSSQLSSLRRNNYAIQDFIQTDAAINPGNSGGPLVNIRGEVIGINSAIASPTGTYTGYGFAIPITLAKTVMDDIIAHGRVRRAIMGAALNEVSAEDAAANKLKEIAGARIENVQILDDRGQPTDIESPSKVAGIEPGDVIIAMDGKPVDRVSTLQRLVRIHQPGDVITLEGVRYGEKKTFKVKLIEAPSAQPSKTVAASPHKTSDDAATATAALSRLGITVEALTPRLVEARSVNDKLKGVIVNEVTPGSPAEGKLFQDDVITGVRFPNQAPIFTAADLQREIGKVSKGGIVGLLVSRTNPRDGTVTARVVNLRVAD